LKKIFLKYYVAEKLYLPLHVSGVSCAQFSWCAFRDVGLCSAWSICAKHFLLPMGFPM